MFEVKQLPASVDKYCTVPGYNTRVCKSTWVKVIYKRAPWYPGTVTGHAAAADAVQSDKTHNTTRTRALGAITNYHTTAKSTSREKNCNGPKTTIKQTPTPHQQQPALPAKASMIKVLNQSSQPAKITDNNDTWQRWTDGRTDGRTGRHTARRYCLTLIDTDT